MNRGNGAMGAGCAAFSLLGLLIGVGLTVWLGSRALDSVSPARDRASDSVDGATGDAGHAGQSPTTEPAPTGPVPVIAAATPATGLTDGATVTVTSDGFDPGEQVTVRQCVVEAGSGLVLHGEDPCAEGGTPGTVDPQGRLSVTVTTPAMIEAGLLPWDCSTSAGFCALIVFGPEGTRSIPLPLEFAG